MKRIAITIVCLIASISYVDAQKILVDEFDPFDKVRRVQTSFIKICDSSPGEKMMARKKNKQVLIAIENIGGVEYIRLKWLCDDLIFIPKGEIIKFLDADGEVYEMENLISKTAEKGEGVTGLYGSGILGVNLRLEGEPGILKGKSLKAIRIQYTHEYVTIEVDQKAEKKISKLYNVYQKAMNKGIE